MTTKKRFDTAMARCQNLCSLYSTTRNEDLFRAAVVLGVAALDGYVVDRFMDVFVDYIKSTNMSKREIQFLEEAGFKLKDALDIIREKKERPFRHVRTIVEHAYEHNSMQDFDKIGSFYGFLGLPRIVVDSARMAAKAARVKNARGKTAGQRIIDDLRAMMDRRQDIAHSADYNGKNRLNKMVQKEVEKWLKYLGTFVDSMEKIMQNKFLNGRRV